MDPIIYLPNNPIMVFRGFEDSKFFWGDWFGENLSNDTWMTHRCPIHRTPRLTVPEITQPDFIQERLEVKTKLDVLISTSHGLERDEQCRGLADLVEETPYNILSVFLEDILDFLMRCVWLVEDALTLGKEHKRALTGVVCSFQHRHFGYFHKFIGPYYPDQLPALFQTFVDVESLDKNWFMDMIVNCLKKKFYSFFHTMRTIRTKKSNYNADADRYECFCFGSLVLSLVSPLKYCSHNHTSPGSLASSSHRCDFNKCDLFVTAVDYKLVDEAKLLFETGLVCRSELDLLAQRPDMKKILDGDVKTPMATFLRSVFRGHQSLQSAAAIAVSRHLGPWALARPEIGPEMLSIPAHMYSQVTGEDAVKDYRKAVMLRTESKTQTNT